MTDTFPGAFVPQALTIGSTRINAPVYTFQINLSTPTSEVIGPITNQRTVTMLSPDMYTSSPDTGRKMAAQHAAGYTTWIPGFLRGENIVLNNNGTITAYGKKAVYLYQNFTTGTNPLLTLTSIAPYTDIPIVEGAFVGGAGFVTGPYRNTGSGGAKGGGAGIFKYNGVSFT